MSAGASGWLTPPSTPDVRQRGRGGCPHLVHADVVAQGTLDHGRVVVDIQDSHLQEVLLLPRGAAPVRSHNLRGGEGDSKTGAGVGTRNVQPTGSPWQEGWADRLANPSLPGGLWNLPGAFSFRPCCGAHPRLTFDPHLARAWACLSLHLLTLPLTPTPGLLPGPGLLSALRTHSACLAVKAGALGQLSSSQLGS